jgi:hypothetical protein
VAFCVFQSFTSTERLATLARMTKFKEYYNRMYEAHKAEFDAFRSIHDGYQMDRPEWAERFHGEGMKLMTIIKDWERRLCNQMEKGANSQYSAKLAEKFMAEIKKNFPLIERIGLRSSLDQRPAAKLIRSLD